jgi:MraZ protein
MDCMLRGNSLAKVDEKGRLKLPAAFRAIVEPRYGTEFFVTSFRGDSVRIYPLPVYAAFEERLERSSQVEPLVDRLRSAVNYYGQGAVMDTQGRVLIHPLLRRKAGIEREVAVIGQQNLLVVWNHRALEERLDNHPLTDDELRALASLGF